MNATSQSLLDAWNKSPIADLCRFCADSAKVAAFVAAVEREKEAAK